MSTKTRRYQIWTYDVLGNEEDGYEVNDRRKQHTADIVCQPELMNPGTPHKGVFYSPTPSQLNKAVAATAPLDWEGEDDHTLYATCPKTGYPAGELEFLGFVDADGNLKE